MKWIIAGTRTMDDQFEIESLLLDTLKKYGMPEIVVTGGAKGVDRIGHAWAVKSGLDTKIFPADWNADGKAAGPIRNARMADYIKDNGMLVLIWDGHSKGSANMKRTAERKGIKVVEYVLSGSGQSI